MRAVGARASCTLAVFAASVGGVPMVDGLYVESWGSAAAPTLLYLHGGPGQSAYEFGAHQGELLAAAGLHVVVMDQRGVLRSEPLPSDGTLTVADLIADCETVRKHLGIESWAILGQSFGGMVGVRYALEHPASVSAVLFENPSWDVDRSCASILDTVMRHPVAARHADAAERAADALRGEPDARRLWAALLDVLARLGPDRDIIYVPDEATRARIRALLANAPFPPEMWARAGSHVAKLTRDDDFYAPHTPLLKRLTQPVLLIKGELDPIPSRGEVDDFRRALPDAQVQVFAGCGHFVQAEHPHEYADLVSGFVRARY